MEKLIKEAPVLDNKHFLEILDHLFLSPFFFQFSLIQLDSPVNHGELVHQEGAQIRRVLLLE